MILAIDPGPTMSALCMINNDYRPHSFAKISNHGVLPNLREFAWQPYRDSCAIEMISHYGTGMPAGQDVFDTCVWIGRFTQCLEDHTPIEAELIKRREVKLHLCGSARAKDGNITQALIDRFAPGERNHGKGVKNAPGWFYGFHSDVWQAYALAVYVADRQRDAT